MSWTTHHSNSEHYVTLAELAVSNGNNQSWLELYRRAAMEEALALSCLSKRKTQTRGEMAVRVVALWLNAGNKQQAQLVANQLLKEGSLPPFAVAQLQSMFIGKDVLIAPPRGMLTGSKSVGKAQVPLLVNASAPQLTILSPNSNCSAVGSGDVNNSTLLQFMTPPNQISYWSAMASEALSPVVLSANIGNAIVTFQAGLTVSFHAAGGNLYYVFLNGSLIDNDTTYKFTGSVVYNSSQT